MRRSPTHQPLVPQPIGRRSPIHRPLARRRPTPRPPARWRAVPGAAGALVAGTLAAATLLGGCGGSGAGAPPLVDDGWAAPVDDQAAAVYMTITAPEGDELTAARVARSVAARAEVVNPGDQAERGPGHLGHLDPGGSLGDDHRHTVRLPADRPVTLEPDGAYLAIGPLTEPLASGATFPVTLSFRDAEDVTVDVTVQNARARRGRSPTPP